MYKSLRRALAIAAALLCLTGAACAAPAREITRGCRFNGERSSSIQDESYRSVWKSGGKNGLHALTVTAPESETIGGLLIRWADQPLSLKAEAQDENGQWQMVGGCDADFFAQYLPVDGYPAVRLSERDTGGRTQLQISSITVLSPGDVPPEIQQWQKPSDKVELMLVSAHPDDEVLWFGGLLPDYAGARGRETLVVNACYARSDRRLELLDCLWTCGVQTYPVFLGYPDILTGRPEKILRRWKWEQILNDLVTVYRRHRPDVLVLHAEDGESGHGAHKVMSKAGREAVMAAADDTQFPLAGDAWEIPKVYLHKHAENTIQLDWHVPLERFSGRTAFEMADQGFQCHRSQLGGEWFMTVGGENDNSLFGLWQSTVGEDVAKNDFFENIGR